MLQQWARQFLRLTQAPQPDPKTKARIRALFAGSTDKLFIKCLGYLLPCYLHLSVLLFFIGLLLFLHDINTRIFNATLWFFMFSMTIYTFFTILPFFLHNSLLFTPVSAFPVAIVAFIICIVTTTFGFRFNAKLSSVFERLFKYIERTASSALDRLAELDTHILEATLDSLGDDDAVERFFEAIPDFFPSNSSELLPLTHQFANKFKRVMCAFLDRTFQPTMVAESVKSSRLLICLNASRAAWPLLGSEATSDILFNILNGRWPELLQSVEIGHSLRSWSHGGDEEHIRHVRSIVSRIIANTEKHNDRWSALVEDELGVSKDLLSDYLAHSDNVLLATFNNITRQIFRSHHRYWNVSSLLSKCDVSRALPSLQHDFCDLWNDIVREAQGPDRSISADIVKDLRHHFIALHTDSTDCDAILDQAWSYPSCTIAAHRPHPLPNTYGHPAEDISHALATHSSTQAVPLPLRGDVPVAGIRPLDLPAHHNTSPLPNFSASQPFPTPSDVTTIDARTDISSISSTANPNSHPISSGMATSQQNELVVLPPVILFPAN
jgi:hypothetical protein